jgi:hypothetical protein
MNLSNQVFSRFSISKISVFSYATTNAALPSVGLKGYDGLLGSMASQNLIQVQIETLANIPSGSGSLQATVDNNFAACSYLVNTSKYPIAVKLMKAQGNATDPKKHPEFAGIHSTVDTRPFHYPLI